MNLEKRLKERGVTEILHFTTNKGIVGTLASHSLMSRYRLPQESSLKYILHVNAAHRVEADDFFDKTQNWLDYVNLSISEINTRYFAVSQRWHVGADIWWGILGFDARAAAEDGVVFATTNNSYDRCVRGTGIDGFEALFKPTIQRKSPRWSVARSGRASHLPTCEQAEVLYPSMLSTGFLRTIYVSKEEHQDQANGWLKEFGFSNVKVIMSPRKFSGAPN